VNSSNSSFDARENLLRRIGLVVLIVAVAVDLLLGQMNLESHILASILTAIEFLAIGLLVWVYVSRRRRQGLEPKTGVSHLANPKTVKGRRVPITQKKRSTENKNRKKNSFD